MLIRPTFVGFAGHVIPVVLVTMTAACGGPEYGIGQGQPAYPVRSVTATPRAALKIASVYVTPAGSTATAPAGGYLTLANTGSAAIDFTKVTWFLVASAATVALDATQITSLQTPLEAGQTRALSDTELADFSRQLKPAADQVAVVDSMYAVQAYAAWGSTAPVAPLPVLTVAALQSGAIAQPSDSFLPISGTPPDPLTWP